MIARINDPLYQQQDDGKNPNTPNNRKVSPLQMKVWRSRDSTPGKWIRSQLRRSPWHDDDKHKQPVCRGPENQKASLCAWARAERERARVIIYVVARNSLDYSSERLFLGCPQ